MHTGIQTQYSHTAHCIRTHPAQALRFWLLLLLPALVLLLGVALARRLRPEQAAQQLLAHPPRTGAVQTVGTSSAGRSIDAYRYGEGENVMVLTFCIHGFEDGFPHDGMALVETAYRLMRELPDWDLEGWTVYVLPCLNPDGLCDGASNTGFGRCNAENLDINRCFPTGWTARSESRYYNGDAPLQSVEARAIAEFLQQVQGGGVNLCIDVHGWYQQILTSDGQEGSALYQAFSAEFPENAWADVTRGDGYLANYAASLGYQACLFEFPNDEAADLETFLQSDQPQRFLNAVQELLEGGL